MFVSYTKSRLLRQVYYVYLRFRLFVGDMYMPTGLAIFRPSPIQDTDNILLHCPLVSWVCTLAGRR